MPLLGKMNRENLNFSACIFVFVLYILSFEFDFFLNL